MFYVDLLVSVWTPSFAVSYSGVLGFCEEGALRFQIDKKLRPGGQIPQAFSALRAEVLSMWDLGAHFC